LNLALNRLEEKGGRVEEDGAMFGRRFMNFFNSPINTTEVVTYYNYNNSQLPLLFSHLKPSKRPRMSSKPKAKPKAKGAGGSGSKSASRGSTSMTSTEKKIYHAATHSEEMVSSETRLETRE